MRDKRGIERGQCSLCDCEEYEFQETNLSCGYCGDPPAKHVVVPDPDQTRQIEVDENGNVVKVVDSVGLPCPGNIY